MSNDFTPGPWRVAEGFPSVETDEAPHLALCNDPHISMRERMANARRIVQCVNSHDALVGALKAVLNAGRGFSGRLILDARQEEAVRAAIASAEQQSPSPSTAGDTP